MGVANFVYHKGCGDGFLAPCVLEIETMQKLINPDSNGTVKAIRACYEQCGFDSVFRGGGQGITGVMEEVTIFDDFNSRIPKDQNVIGTITTNIGCGTPRNGYKLIEKLHPKIAASRGRGEGNHQRLEVNKNGTANCLTSVAKDNLVMEHNLRMEGGCLVDKEGRRYRIRKLTPRECFRLMDVKDEDIDKIQQAGISKTNLYKLAGNSIVVSCMFHLFRKLFIEKECENEQLSLF